MLKREYGLTIGQTRVRRLLKQMNLPKIATKKMPTLYKKSNDENCLNLLKRQFNVAAPNLVWVSDITYLKVASKWFYLCVIIDLFSRKVIAWKLSTKIDTQLVIDTFNKAYTKRGCPKGLMFHSDRGSQYTSLDFRALLERLEVVQSFSGKGNPYDNAVAESFFKFLKAEEIYIESYYNSKRPHSTLNFLSPVEFENNYFLISCPLS